MAIEKGVVIALGAGPRQTAWVETIRSSACESCASKESCNTGGLGSKSRVEAVNEAGAQVGDHIHLSISSSSLVKSTFLIYLFPVLCLLAGAIAGNSIAPRIGAPASNTSLATALIALACALCYVRVRGNQLSRKADYQPKIIRVIPKGPQWKKTSNTPNACTRPRSNST